MQYSVLSGVMGGWELGYAAKPPQTEAGATGLASAEPLQGVSSVSGASRLPARGLWRPFCQGLRCTNWLVWIELKLLVAEMRTRTASYKANAQATGTAKDWGVKKWLRSCSNKNQISRASHFGYAAAQERARGSRRESWGWHRGTNPKQSVQPRSSERLRGSALGCMQEVQSTSQYTGSHISDHVGTLSSPVLMSLYYPEELHNLS